MPDKGMIDDESFIMYRCLITCNKGFLLYLIIFGQDIFMLYDYRILVTTYDFDH